jgi:hypothetical protein
MLMGGLFGPAIAWGEDLFSLSATGGGKTGFASGKNVIDLASDAIESRNEFETLSGSAFTAMIRYGRLSDAVLFSRNAAGTSATLTIPSTGFAKTFNAANEDDLKDQIRDFFKKDGADEYAAFLRSINEQTTIGVSDGNPLSTTALMADASFYRFGFQPARFDTGEGPRLPAGFDLDISGGKTRSDDGDGYYVGGSIGNIFRLGDRVGFALEFDARYRNVEGAAVYQVVNTDALPIQIIQPGTGGGFSWTVSPAFVIGAGGSWDMAAGGVPIGGQITSSLSYRTGGWTFLLADQYGYYGGLPISLSDFRFETDIDQQIVKNGIQVIRTFGNFFIDAGASYTSFLNDASVKDYWSPEAGVGIRFGSSSGLRLGYHGDFSVSGDSFINTGGEAQLFVSF